MSVINLKGRNDPQELAKKICEKKSYPGFHILVAKRLQQTYWRGFYHGSYATMVVFLVSQAICLLWRLL